MSELDRQELSLLRQYFQASEQLYDLRGALQVIRLQRQATAKARSAPEPEAPIAHPEDAKGQ